MLLFIGTRVTPLVFYYGKTGQFAVVMIRAIKGTCLQHAVHAVLASTVEFEIGFSSEHSMIFILTHILCALTLYG
jgi:hypothetical protein